MPQAIERSLATPITRPRLPAINLGTEGSSTALETGLAGAVPMPPPDASGAAVRMRSSGIVPSVIVAREQQAGVGAAEAEAVRHHGLKARLVDALACDGITLGAGIEILDV